MPIASTALKTALAVVALAHGGLLACSTGTDASAEPGLGGAGIAGALSTAGAGGAAQAGEAGLAGTASVAGSGTAVAGSGGSGGSAGGSSGGVAGAGSAGIGGAAPFALTSSSIMKQDGCGTQNLAACDKFAPDFLLPTIGGANHSPELDWTAGPSGTLSYAIVLYDETNKYTHWAIWNIPASTSKLPASLAGGADPAGLTGVKQVSFYMNKDAYAGPGAKSHVYQFKLYALKVASVAFSTQGTDAQITARDSLEKSADVLAKVELLAATPQ